MSESDYTRPERFTEIGAARRRFEKRYKSLVARKGLCSVCVHRAQEPKWQRFHCRLQVERQYPGCQTDKRGPVFEADIPEIEKLRDAA